MGWRLKSRRKGHFTVSTITQYDQQWNGSWKVSWNRVVLRICHVNSHSVLPMKVQDWNDFATAHRWSFIRRVSKELEFFWLTLKTGSIVPFIWGDLKIWHMDCSFERIEGHSWAEPDWKGQRAKLWTQAGMSRDWHRWELINMSSFMKSWKSQWNSSRARNWP